MAGRLTTCVVSDGLLCSAGAAQFFTDFDLNDGTNGNGTLLLLLGTNRSWHGAALCRHVLVQQGWSQHAALGACSMMQALAMLTGVLREQGGTRRTVRAAGACLHSHCEGSFCSLLKAHVH
jgi:hypothetical protein